MANISKTANHPSCQALPQALPTLPSITNHSCVSNTRHGREGEAFCLVATTDIPQGAQVAGGGGAGHTGFFRNMLHSYHLKHLSKNHK